MTNTFGKKSTNKNENPCEDKIIDDLPLNFKGKMCRYRFICFYHLNFPLFWLLLVMYTALYVILSFVHEKIFKTSQFKKYFLVTLLIIYILLIIFFMLNLLDFICKINKLEIFYRFKTIHIIWYTFSFFLPKCLMNIYESKIL